MTNRVGQRLGNYQIIRLLGQGGFAEVYLGKHVFLGTQAAIKVLQVRLADDERESFLNEARTLAGLSHPNILRVLEFGIDENVPFLVLEYAPNGTLRQRHPKGSILPLTIVLPYVRQIAAALQYLHTRKLIHRDIKPENLLLGPNNEVLLSDFGTALVVQTLHEQITSEMAGTVTYMAPEQLRGKPRPASDQYGLAVVVYEWLCGNPPFTGSFIALSSQHMLMPPPSLRAVVPTIPYHVEQIVMTALAKEPEHRFASVSAFANALEQASRPEVWFVPSTNPLVFPSSPLPASSLNSFSSGEVLPTLAPSVTEATKTQVSAQPSYGVPPPGSATKVLPPSRVASGPILPQPATQAGRRFPRRTVTMGLLGLGSVVAAGALSWLAVSKLGLVTATSSTPTPTPSKPKAGTTFVTYKGHGKPVYAVAWSPNGQYIASGGGDEKARVWNPTPPSGQDVNTYIEHSGSVNALAWSSNGQRIASAGSDSMVRVWDALTGSNSIHHQHANWVRAVAWSPDSMQIASAGDDTTVQVWDATTANTLVTYRGHSKLVWAVAWSPHGSQIASGSVDKTVQVWDATTGKMLVTYRGHSESVKTVAWSPDGKYIASGSVDKTVQVWDATTGKMLVTYTGHPTDIYSVVWSPDGQHIASSSEEEVRVWDPLPPDGTTLNVYSEQAYPVHAVTWSPDGQRIASGGNDNIVRVWQAL